MSDQKRIAAARPFFPEEDLPGVLAAIGDVLRGGRLILGPRTRELEATWAARIGTKHAIAVSSCTAALAIAYRHVGVAGREVVVPTNTFVATANAAVAAGAKVVFADMADDYGIDLDDALAKVGPRTAAIVVVHIGGIVAGATTRLREECQRRKIALIEDCAHAHGAMAADGRSVGALGEIGCWSFYPTKILTCGAGGMITTNDDALADLARSLRHHGQGASLEEIVHAGDDWLMDEVRAVLALAQVRRLDQFLATRRAVATRYAELLGKDARVTLPRPPAGTNAAWYKYPILLPEGVDRDRVRDQLNAKHGVETGGLYSPPCHLMPVFRASLGTTTGMFPRAEALLRRQLCLPMHSALTLDDADRSVAALDAVLRDHL